MILPFLVALIAPVQDGGRALHGPATVCGTAFAVTLTKGETLEWRVHGPDFVTYALVRPDGETVIYEGNFPQPGGVVTETGRSWPAKVAVHGPPEIAKRLRFDKQILSKCNAAGGSLP